MKAPSIRDRFVAVRAYLTDETFGYDHWRAAQFSAPESEVLLPAVLLLFDTKDERDKYITEKGAGDARGD